MINVANMEALALKAMGEKSFGEQLLSECLNFFKDYKLTEAERQGLARFQEARKENPAKNQSIMTVATDWWSF